jgi:chlorobactene glucosyltransferase
VRILTTVILIAWVLTLIRTIVNLLLIPRLRGEAARSGPLVSVVIPARNEERRIELTVLAFLRQTYADLEVIVVNDRSTDGTGPALQRVAAENPRLRVVDGEETPPGWLGKPWALHQGSRVASGEYLLFVDADIFYAPDAVANAVAQISGSGVAMTTLLPHFEMAGFWEPVAMPMLAVTVFSFLPTWIGNRTKLGVLSLGAGTGNLVRRADYDAVGGHTTLRDAVVDDVGLARLLRRNGRRTMAVRADDFVSLRMYHGASEIIEGFTKNIFGAIGRRYSVAAVSLDAGVVFHLVPYVLMFTGDVPSLITVALITLTRLILFASLRYSLVAALLGHPLMFLFWMWVTVRSVWMTGIRRQVQWRGRTYDASRTRFGG